MAKFLTDLIVKEIDDNTWKLFADLDYQSDVLQSTICVPTGFVTDFASIPRVPLAYWLAGGTASEAAVIHDYLYQTHLTTRKEADDVLLEAMKVTHIAAWRRPLIYTGVRLGGWLAWKSGPKRFTLLGN